ncbi:MAG: DUF421 domain-containing protein [Elusimicrobia bacterium]|nr:DUF421 domain-containing protein [Elusimicrobiota bacterium]
MWHLFIPDISLAEKLLRSFVIYIVLYLIIRLTGKRQVAQMTPFDLVVLLVLANVVQNAVIGPDNSLGGGIIGAVAIVGLNWLMAEAAFRSKKARRLIEGEPVLLIHDGRILRRSLDGQRITVDELMAALRENGVADPLRVRFAVLEDNGKISVMAK